MPKITDVLPKQIRKMGELIKKSDVLRKNYADGSYEEHMKLVRPAVIAGSGCERPDSLEDVSDPMSMPKQGTHWQDVLATFPEYAIVSCDAEDKAWRVPYMVDGSDVTTGDPEEVTQVFVPTSGEDEDEGDDSEGL